MPKHQGSVQYGLAFALLSFALVALAFPGNGSSWLLLWPAACLAWLAGAYLSGEPERLGKDSSTGKLHVGTQWALAPFFLLTWFTWHLTRLLSTEHAHDPLTDDLHLGRRLLQHELPSDLKTVVDLTAEFDAPSYPRVHYLSRPILAGTAPAPATLLKFAQEVVALPRPLLIHCAQGHGRTSTMAAAVLLVEGSSPNVDEALERVQKARPLAAPNRSQRQALVELARLLGSGTGSSMP